jgi:putative DNA primase/helicase
VSTQSKPYEFDAAAFAEPLDVSEDALALEFTNQTQDLLRYVEEWKRWLRWDGTRWRPDRDLSVFDQARRVCRERADLIDKPTQQTRVRSAPTVAAVVQLAKADRTHARVTEDFDVDPLLFNTPGGTVDLRTGELREARRVDGITKCSTVTPGGACGLWLRCLERWTGGDVALVGFLQRLMGYTLTGLVVEEIFAFFYGTGGNGKGSFLNLFTAALGDYAAVAPIETFTESKTERHPTDLAMLRGARLVVSQETSGGKRWDETRIKALTGSDPVSARFMRGDFFTYTPQFKLVVAGNNKPGLRNVDEAIRRRFRLVPFVVTITPEEREALPDLKARLALEAPGVLAWAIQGCLEWQQSGLQAPPSVLAATSDYFVSQDSVGRWIEEQCVVAPHASATKAALYADWKAWAEAGGEFVLAQRVLLERLQERLSLDEARIGKGRDRTLIGIGLRGDE